MTALPRKTTTTGVAIKSADQGLALIRFAAPDGLTVDHDGDVTAPDAFPEGASAW